MSLAFNPTDPAFIANPYPIYQLLRHHAPVVFAAEINSWVLSRYADVAAAFRDPRLGVDAGNETAFKTVALADPRVRALAGMFGKQMLFRDPPEHTRLRGLVNKAFTPKVVEGLRPAMQKMVDELLDAAAARGAMDVIADLAFPLPVNVIAVLLGVPEEDHAQFNAWSRALTLTLEPLVPAEAMLQAGQAAEEILSYFRHLVARKRQRPGDDLLTGLIHAEEEGHRLDTEELLANAVLLLVAGHETTVNLIGNGAMALMQHPDQAERLRREPGLIESAVEEVLRYDSPVQLSSRLAKEATTIGGQAVPAGSEVLMLIGSANHDEARFDNAGSFDIGRADNKHLSFGGGVHYCLGAPLARVEGELALLGLARRFPKMRPAGEPLRRPSAVLRGLTRLPVTLA